ncbi:adenosylcobinamide-phosphate synthase CbiB [Marinomonas sp. 15G1-11]|uniref:Cobalamin biosynthesis protein CobD n=1 Tax=Marinomonas phaeophyticola TaxID=3004091 RepID=A0ABT4JRP7_9GAMM|nr:adenosylcobinamide-phosphate synthase CbiB [Marinomonas sp. 15G1-11]MCZ2721003.1 adenosylcobinamide-phosphate synthase CbiB [Marinomonas sp. 15G1-11]
MIFEWFSASFFSLFGALILDRLIGEPKSWHPLVWFGKWADSSRLQLQRSLDDRTFDQRRAGILAWCLAVLPWLLVLLVTFSLLPVALSWLLSTVVLYFCIGWQSLREHALAIELPLLKHDLDTARTAVSHIVSRDTQALTAEDVSKAGIESVLENGSDAVYAPIFWFFILGAPGVLLYRLANTLDAMWGYKTSELKYFGWFAARFDDVLNFIPARLVVYTYALCGMAWGNGSRARRCARQQSLYWKSPNAGPVMAAGAGALGVKLGGDAVYFGKKESRPILGEGRDPAVNDLTQAITLIDRGVFVWVILIYVLI